MEAEIELINEEINAAISRELHPNFELEPLN
jgi:hypothetical protein